MRRSTLGSPLFAVFAVIAVSLLATPCAAQEPLALSPSDYGLRLYNVDDVFRAYVTNSRSNRKPLITTNYGKDSGIVDITPSLAPGNNQIILELTNTGGGYTYSYQLLQGTRVLAQGSCGTSGVIGCNNNDYSTGIKFQKTLAIDYSEEPTCAASGEPTLSTRALLVDWGRSVSVDWTKPSPDLDSGGWYEVETSVDGFATVLKRERIAGSKPRSLLIRTEPLGSPGTLSVRVRAVKSCGAAGKFSDVLTVSMAATPTQFVFLGRQPESSFNIIVPIGAPGVTRIETLRNLAPTPATVHLTVAPPFQISPASALVGGYQDLDVTITAPPEALHSITTIFSAVQAFYGTGSLWHKVILNVTGTTTGTDTVAVVSETITIHLSSISRETVIINLGYQSGRLPFYTTSIGPGGAWLNLSAEPFGVVPESGRIVATFRVDASKVSRYDGPPPYTTAVSFNPYGGSETGRGSLVYVVFVPDSDEPVPGAGARSEPPPGDTSQVVPVTVNATSGVSSARSPLAGGAQTFTSDGWLKNLSGGDAPATLFYTPDGADGLVDPRVLKSTLTLPSGGTVRLSDVVSSTFHLVGSSGQLEVRSPEPHALSLRMTAESLKGNDPSTRFGTEIPVVAYREGARAGGPELVVPGIDDDATNRANLILAETSGRPATVHVTVNDAGGAQVGALDWPVAPYSKTQINRLVDAVAPGRPLSGGWAGITVTSGDGSVAPLATVIDNRSGSFSAVLGRPVRGTGGARYVVPSVARTVGLFNTHFVTRLNLVNGASSPADVTLTYTYTDQDDGGAVKSSRKLVVIPARGALAKEVGADVIASLFGVTNRSFGSITIEGDVGKVVGVAAVSAEVDPEDPSKGLKSAQVNAVFSDAPEVLELGDAEVRFPGAERSLSKRTNLILVELAGEPCQVVVRGYTPAGDLLASRTVDLLAGQYQQITDVFGGSGFDLGIGAFQNVEVTAQVTSGTGRVVAIASVNDNLSRNPGLFVLLPPGPPVR